MTIYMEPLSPLVIGPATPCRSEVSSVYIPNPPREDSYFPNPPREDSYFPNPPREDSYTPNPPRPSYLPLPTVLEETVPLVGGPQQQPNYGLCGPAHTQLHAQLQPHEEVYEDRKNEFFPLKRFVFMSFGVPGAPSLSTEAQRCGTCFAIPFYLLLAVWGFVLIGITTVQDGYIWRRRCPDILPAKIFTILTGVLCVCLCLYWLALYWWSRNKASRTQQTHHRDFSKMALLWWLLSMFFSVVTTGLSMEVYRHNDILLNMGGPHRNSYLHCGSSEQFPPTLPPSGGGATVSPNNADGDPYILSVPTNTVPLWALGTLFILLLVYVCVFVVNAVTLRCSYRQKSLSKFWK